jgi:hypothetical protein
MRGSRFLAWFAGAVALAALVGASSSAGARSATGGTVRYVSAMDSFCAGRTPCYGSIQEAIDDAAPGDEIDVAEGAYSGVHTIQVAGIDYVQVVLVDKPLRLLGGFASDWSARDPQTYGSLIDPDRSGRGITVLGEAGAAVEISGFTIVHGDYTALGNPPEVANQACGRTGGDCGGGLFARSVRLRLTDSFIVDNVASRNSTFSDGGGAYLWNLAPGSVISNSLFYGNSAGAESGGGGGACILYGSDLTVDGCTFSQNSAGGHGGALSILQPAGPITVSRSSMLGNNSVGDSGGALWASLENAGDALVIDRDVFGYNAAADQGAAICVEKAGLETSRVRIANALFLYNSAGAGYSSVVDAVNANGADKGALEIDASHVTAGVVGTAAFLRLSATQGATARAALTNTLVAYGQAMIVGEQGGGSGVEIRHTHTLAWQVPDIHIVQSGAPVFDAIALVSGDPMLDYEGRPALGSAAIDAGVDSDVRVDLDGMRRPVGVPDIGAFEYAERLYVPVALRGEPSRMVP